MNRKKGLMGLLYSILLIGALQANSAENTLFDNLHKKGTIELQSKDMEENWTPRLSEQAEAKWDGRMLYLKNANSKSSALWILNKIPLVSDQEYFISGWLKANKGADYALYLENNSSGRWQNAGPIGAVAKGDWQPIIFTFKMKQLEKPSYLALQLRSGGELRLRDLIIGTKQGNKPIVNGDFEEGKLGWLLKDNAQIIENSDSSGNHALELQASDPKVNTKVISFPISVEKLQHYRLSWNVRGINGYGDSTSAHFFRVYPIDKNFRPLAGTDKWIDCMGYTQNKALEFDTLPRSTNINLVLESRAPSRILIDDFVLEKREVKKVAAQIVLDAPFYYRDGVFASNLYSKITGILAIHDKASATIELILRNGAGNTIFKQNLDTSNDNLKFTVPAPPVGENHVLTMIVKDATGKELCRENKTLRTFPKAKNEVTFTADGITLVNGHRIFPIGHWWTTERSSLDVELAFFREAGFNNLFLKRTPGVLEQAAKHDMMVVLHIQTAIHGATPEAKEKSRSKLIADIKNLSEAPNLLAYFGPDEPAWRGLPLASYSEVHDLITKLDPYHPYWINEAPRGQLRELRIYGKAADIYGCDIYPVPEGGTHSELKDKGLTSVGKYTDLFLAAANYRKPIWMILQAFAWAQCGHPDVPAEKSIYPTWKQSRFMVYNSILHGATGIQYHYLGYSPNVSDQFWKDLRQVTLELEYLQPVICADTVRPSTISCSNPDIRFMQKKYQDRNYYLITNESPKPVTALFSGLTERSLNMLFANAPLSVINGQLTLELEGRGVAVLSAATFEKASKIYKPETYVPYSQMPGRSPKLTALKANWIWYPDESRVINSACHLRRSFVLDSAIRDAKLLVIADDILTDLRINGKEVSLGKTDIDAFDIGPMLKQGDNLIEIQAKDGGAAPCACLVLLKATDKDGKQIWISSDATWEASKNGTKWQPVEVICPLGKGPWGYPFKIESFLKKCGVI